MTWKAWLAVKMSRAARGAVIGGLLGLVVVVVAFISTGKPQPVGQRYGSHTPAKHVYEPGEADAPSSEEVLRGVATAQAEAGDVEGALRTVKAMRGRGNQDAAFAELVARLTWLDNDGKRSAAARLVADGIENSLTRADALRRIAEAQLRKLGGPDSQAAVANLAEATRLTLAGPWSNRQERTFWDDIREKLGAVGLLVVIGGFLGWFFAPTLEAVRDLANRWAVERYGPGALAKALGSESTVPVAVSAASGNGQPASVGPPSTPTP